MILFWEVSVRQAASFGLKKAKVYYKTTKNDESDYEVFFPKDGTNHPTCSSCAGCPNWFYYWKGGGVCGIPATALYDPSGSFGWCQPSVDSIIRLGPDAPTTNTGPETYTKDDGTTTITVTGQGKGIKCVAETVVHEQNHLTIYSTYNSTTDDDGDGVGNTGEPTFQAVNTLVTDPDTYNMGGGYSSYGDNEVRCRKKELTPVGYDTTKDWANPGCQSKTKFGP